MLCTFTTEHGALIVRSDDIREIADYGDGARLAYMVGDEAFRATIIGTATENAARIAQDEFDLMARVETHRYKTQQLLQAQPTPRGRQAK
jgi:hypothetical protein